MELSNQLTSLEISQRLDKLGVKHDSLFYWTYSNMFGKIIYYLQYFEPVEGGYDEESMEDDIPAYTVAELGEMFVKQGEIEMPKWNGRTQKWERELAKGGWISENTEANARGLLLCYLREHNLISLTDINK